MIKIENYLNQKQRVEIGFDYVLNNLAVLSAYGQELLKRQTTYRDAAKLAAEFERIALVKQYLLDHPRLFKESEIYLARIKNINAIFDNLELVCLDEVDIFEVKKYVFNVMKLAACFKQVEGIDAVFNFYDFTSLFEYLDQDNSQMPFFSLYDEYSSQMAQLRQQVKRGDLSEEEHDRLKRELKAEEQAVRIAISNYIKGYHEQLVATAKKIAYLDLLIAKAKMVLKYDLKKPELADNIELVASYNPLIKAIVEEKGYDYIPLNIAVEQNVQLITGSNMAGKSITLKNILLNTLCFQYGMYPFAKEAKLPILDFVVYISDELQDVSNSLSSFGKEVHVLSETLAFIEGKKGLIVLDEFARGTNPIEAKMIVAGLCRYLKEKNYYSVLSTHLDLNLDIDYLHYQVVGLSNLSEETTDFEDISKVMDYSLMKVDRLTKVPNDAFKVMNFFKINEDLKRLIEIEYEKETNDEQN